MLWLLWKHRRDIWTWLTTRSQGTKLLMASTAGVFLLVAAGVGYKVNHYMEHDNDFCRGCHVFIPAGQPFVRPDTGTYLIVNQLEGKHDTLECHDCHLPDKIAQAKELVLWMVDRPDKVPAARQGAAHRLQELPRVRARPRRPGRRSSRRRGTGCTSSPIPSRTRTSSA